MKKTGLALLLGLALLGGCSTSAPIVTTSQTVDSRKAVSTEQMQTAIYQSLKRYGWNMESDNGQTIVAKYNKQNKHLVVVRIDYSAHRFSIRHETSQGMNYNARRHTIHRNYNRWVRNLELDIQSRLSFL